MKNLTKQQYEELINNGVLMPFLDTPNFFLMSRSVHVTEKNIPIGFPILIERNNKAFNFLPKGLLLEHNDNFKSPWQEKPVLKSLFVVPFGLVSLSDNKFYNEEVKKELLVWNELAKNYIKLVPNDIEIKELEIKLLNQFRHVVREYYVQNTQDINLNNEKLLESYCGGLWYRINIKKRYPEISLKSFNSCQKSLISTFENIQDLSAWEEKVLNFGKKNTYHYVNQSSYCRIPTALLNFWTDVKKDLLKEQTYKIDSPFLKNFRAYLYNGNEKRRAGEEIIQLLEQLKEYDFSLIQEDFIYFNNSSPKKAVTKYTQEFLDTHIIENDNQDILISEKEETLYFNTLMFNFDSIKKKINNNVLAAETLVALVEKTFKSEENTCKSIVYTLYPKQGTVEFVLSSLSSSETKTLSKKLCLYMRTVLLSDFLTPDMVKITSSHTQHRKYHEDNKEVTDKFINLKKTVILKERLEENLGEKINNKVEVKKI